MIRVEVFPRFSDIDGMGHVNNTRVIDLFEQGRRDIVKLFIPDLDIKKWKLIVVNININFLDQIYYSDSVFVETRIQRIGNSSFTLAHQVIQNDKVCAKGTIDMVHFDFVQQKAVSIPDDVREQLLIHCEPE